MRHIFKHFSYGQRGFTLIELLVVVAILGVLAAVAVPNVGKFIGKGKTESYETELHNVQTAVMAMLAESTSGKLTGGTGGPATNDMHTILATKVVNGVSTTLYLDEYMTGLGDDPTTTAVETTATKSGCKYAFVDNGTVTQTTPP